ncbi:hypothetical protein BJ322DRAFT_455934 [Thelephora terrestris]|uniref:Uncharacterized protein n=1 Tax=Thelephora terrestris TaxID=56493 RepID=A0A9P6H7M6_9AGAM|nr:hypothetical protein BJ322DRAFT_455934 [Thelephora terrestris]
MSVSDVAGSPSKRTRKDQLTPLLVSPRLAIVLQPATPTTPCSTPPTTPKIDCDLLSPPSVERRSSSKDNSPVLRPPRVISLPGTFPIIHWPREEQGERSPFPHHPSFDLHPFGEGQANLGYPTFPIHPRFTSLDGLNSSPLVLIWTSRVPIYPHSPSNQGFFGQTSSSRQGSYPMYLGSIALSISICAAQVVAVISAVARQETTTSLFVQSSTSSASSTTFDWWPFDDSETQPLLALSSSSQSRTTSTTSSLTPTPSSQNSPLPSPAIIDITALPPSTTKVPRPQVRTKENIRPFSLAPVFVIAGLILGVLVGWSAFDSYKRWAAKDHPAALLPGPAYVPVHRRDAERGERVNDIHGSPSKHTRHGNPYFSYSAGRGFLGRIPSSMLRKPSPSMSQERTKAVGSDQYFAWPSLPDSSRSTPSQSRSTTSGSTTSARLMAVNADDPFISTEKDSKSPTMVAASRTSSRTTSTHASRFNEMLSDEDESSVFVFPISPTLPAEGESEVRTGLFKKIRSKSKSSKRKKQNKRPTSSTSELVPPAGDSPRKSSWTWITGSPSIKPESYTPLPARTSSPRSQPFRTPESSPRKPSYPRSGENVRMVDTSILPASPPTLTSPRLDSEFFFSGAMFDVSGELTPGRTSSSRGGTGHMKDGKRNDADVPEEPSSPQSGRSHRSRRSRSPTKRDSGAGPSRGLSITSTPSISEFPGAPPPKRTPAERFHARRLALGKVDEIVQRSRSQTSVATSATSPGRSTLDTVEESSRFGRVGREFESGGIEQRLFEA